MKKDNSSFGGSPAEIGLELLKASFKYWAVPALIWLAAVSVVIGVIWHFIAKYW